MAVIVRKEREDPFPPLYSQPQVLPVAAAAAAMLKISHWMPNELVSISTAVTSSSSLFPLSLSLTSVSIRALHCLCLRSIIIAHYSGECVYD